MENIGKVNPEGPGPGPKSSSSSSPKSSQEHEALSKLLAKDPVVLGEGMKIPFGKLEETNKRLDEIQGGRRRNLDLCEDQVNQLPAEVQGKFGGEHQAKMLETVPSVQAEYNLEESERRRVMEHCLGLPNILRQILEHFSDKELLQLSFVNQQWNFEARSLLRNRGCLRARVRTSDECLQFEQFAADLEQMRVVPFTGIRLQIFHDESNRCKSLSRKSPNRSCQVILDRLPWKHLAVEFFNYWMYFKDCPAFLLVKRILEERCGVLEELSLNDTKCQFFQCRSFPSLKILKFAWPQFYHEPESPFHDPTFVKRLISRAPNLQKLYMDWISNVQENLMDGSSAVLVATSGLDLLIEQVHESLIHALRTESIYVFGNDACWYFDVELLNRYVPRLIRGSHITLKRLHMDLVFAVPLMCYGILLGNVTELRIRVHRNLEGIQPDTLELVKGFDFTRVFPKLEKVTISQFRHACLASDHISAFVERGIAVAREALPDRAVNIRQLELHYDHVVSTPPLIFLAQLFPHVKTFSVKTNKALQEFPFTLLWEHWGCLEELHVDFDGWYQRETTNLDSAFCGIFPEEVAELRAKDDEYLKAVNIVPVMPSITSMRVLRLFTLRYELDQSIRRSQDLTRMFSKVTGLIGFPRCPALSVKFQPTFRSPEALDHMKPYVTVVAESRP